MSVSRYRRRIQRLLDRKKARAFERNVVFGKFGLWIDRLPEGTPIPEGARVVNDFHVFPRYSRPGPGFTCGYYQERVTTIDGDNGQMIYPPPEEDDDSVEPAEPRGAPES